MPPAPAVEQDTAAELSPAVRAPEVGAPEVWAVRVGAPALGVLWFLAHRGLGKLNPGNLGWLMEGDWAQELIGWLFFRNEPWRMPLGRLEGLAYPVGTTLGFCDTNPWLSVVLRPLSFALPLDFQFNGAWMLLCYVLQAVMGAKLLEALGASWRGRLLGAAVFLCAPVLESRQGHMNLCAQFLLLAVMVLYLSPARAREGRHPLRTLLLALGCVAWACGTHPYLGAMVTALALAFVVRRVFVDRAFGPWQGALALASPVLVALAVFGLFGYLSGGIPQRGTGFGEISADLLTLVNPTRSRLFHPLPLPRLKDEGYGYLGLGVLVLAGVALGLRVLGRVKGPSKALVPLCVAALLCAVFSLADSWTYAGREVLSLRALYDPVRTLVEPFRATGRFIWPLHYLLTLGAVAAVVSAFKARPWLGEVLLALCVGLQLADLEYQFSFEPPVDHAFRMEDPLWELARGHYAHLELAPPVLHDSAGHGCGELFPEPYYQRVGYLAYRLKMTSNSMYVTRLDGDRAHAACAAQERAIATGPADAGTLYIVHPTWLARALRPDSGFLCAAVDHLPVCVVASNVDPFREALLRRRTSPLP